MLGGEEHQARAGVAVRRIAAAGNELHAADAVEQAEVGDVLQRVLQVGRGRRVVDAFELIGRFEGKAAANRDRAGLVDRDAGNAAQQRVLVGVEALPCTVSICAPVTVYVSIVIPRWKALPAERACVAAMILSVRESGALRFCCEPLITTMIVEYDAYPVLVKVTE